jgi:hypothetical protein
LRDAYCEADKRSRANANIHTKTAKKAWPLSPLQLSS